MFPSDLEVPVAVVPSHSTYLSVRRASIQVNHARWRRNGGCKRFPSLHARLWRFRLEGPVSVENPCHLATSCSGF